MIPQENLALNPPRAFQQLSDAFASEAISLLVVEANWRTGRGDTPPIRIRGSVRSTPWMIRSDARFMDLLQRVLPRTYWRVMTKWLEKATAKGSSDGRQGSRR
ncbi:hypothetical protein BRAO375_3700004 [Bradyrhizobium sp. ORS 375]|nr:hypothetical protein BRAO375_3700004 [Bradyrhizobium sp. ORS 375]